MESPKMIQTLEDALLTLEVGQTEAETLNEVSDCLCLLDQK